jgi:hypothetical protein
MTYFSKSFILKSVSVRDFQGYVQVSKLKLSTMKKWTSAFGLWTDERFVTLRLNSKLLEGVVVKKVLLVVNYLYQVEVLQKWQI